MAVQMTLLAGMSDFGSHVRLRQPEISPFWFEVVLAASGASVGSFQSGSNNTIGGRAQHRRPEICCLIVSAVSSLRRCHILAPVRATCSSMLQPDMLPPVRKNIMLTIVKAQMLNRPYIHYIDVKIMNASAG